MELIRILIVQETNWLTRNVIHQHHLAEWMVRMGHDVRVVDYDLMWQDHNGSSVWQPRQVFPSVNRVLDDVTLEVIRPSTINLPLLTHVSWALSSLNEIRHLNDEWPFDVVICLTLTNSYLLARLCRRMGIPFIYVVLEPYHTMMGDRWVRPIARAVEKRALGEASRVLVFTPKMSQYTEQMGARARRVTVLKTGVSLDIFRPDVDGVKQRTNLGIGPEEWVLLFMGWLYDFSGLREIVEAISEDTGLLGCSRLVIVGDGDLLEKLTDLVTEHDLADKVILTGRRPYEDIPGLLAAADVCLLPSQLNDTTRDIVPMKVYEYLAAGRPVVASRLPGLIAEFGNANGILYADHPVGVLSSAVALSEQPEEWRRLSTAARSKAESNADWEKITKQLLDIMLEDLADCQKVE